MKCGHGDNWSDCFLEAIKNQEFSNACLENIVNDMKGWFIRRTPNKEDVKDLSQELAVAIVLYFKNFDIQKSGSGKAYVYTIARNIFVQYWRKKKTTPQIFSTEESSDHNSQEMEQKEAVQYCLNKLDYKQRLIIILRDLEKKSIDDVAQKTGIPQRSQHNYREKAYEILKKCLEKQGFH